MVVTRQKTTRGHLADTRRSSSSAKGAALSLQSDENAPRARRVLGDIKNDVGGPKATVETSGSRRKPLSDRNAPISSQLNVSSNKAAAMVSRPGASAVNPSTRPRRQVARPAKQPKLAGLSTTPAQASQRTRSPKTAMPRQFSHVEIPTISSSSTDSLSAQIEAAEHRSKNKMAAPSHAELIRISPDIDSDDLEYFEASTLQQTQAQPAASNKAKRHLSSTSGVADSDAEATASQGSSDKENVPPLTARPGATADNRQSARTRAGVLREQPTHSTPISQKRKAIQDELPSARQILNDMFDLDSERSSQLESPGAARRAEPLTASAQELLDYQDRGVSKVEAWKAAGHHAAHRKLEGSPTAKSDDGSIAGSWPTEDQSTGTGADAKPRMDDFDEEGLDEFGFILAERKIQDRNKHALLESFEYEEGDLENTSDMFVDIPTETFNASDDLRLAEHAFGRMSSPAIRHEASSVTAEDAAVGRPGDHEVHTARNEHTQSGAESEVEAELSTHSIKQKPEEEAADTSAQRVTRSRTKRKSDVITIEESDDPLTSVTTSPLSSRKSSRQASKSKRTVSGIPLKRNETKEQKVLQVLAAESSSSTANSSAPSTPRATRTRKKAVDSPAAKKLAQDKLLSFLPPRKRVTHTKASGSNGKKTASITSRKGKAASTSRAKPTTSRGRSKKDKSPSPEVEVIEDDDKDEDESDESPKRRTRAKKGKGKTRAANDEDWRIGVNSSPIHSDDSERTKRLKEMRAAEDYSMEYELVLG
ncbi:uncharacterized protein UTRI_05527 [Ustilago trichophora]|uniref:Uncharacterized protein n=1 Tax=Ustilago trichophora TaxID=86804 RepID=A0A5C3EI01_9BASI|nr:uncharacterized protein UTRI_05527 [Ustilago trichophora]